MSNAKGNTLAGVTEKPKDFKVVGFIAQIIAVGLSFSISWLCFFWVLALFFSMVNRLPLVLRRKVSCFYCPSLGTPGAVAPLFCLSNCCSKNPHNGPHWPYWVMCPPLNQSIWRQGFVWCWNARISCPWPRAGCGLGSAPPLVGPVVCHPTSHLGPRHSLPHLPGVAAANASQLSPSGNCP